MHPPLPVIAANPPSFDLADASRPRRVHLLGVAGSGMSGLAGLLLAVGHRVSGSDKVTSAEVERLQGEGLVFSCPHTADAVREAEVVIHSSAIRAGNAAWDEAQRLSLPCLRRAEALAQLLAARRGIIVAGMHGKTTTSAMAAHVLRAAGLRPGHYVGAEIPVLGTNAHWEPADPAGLFVAEGDESDGTLSLYAPEHAILLNVEEEHLDFYADLAAIEAVYRQLLQQTRGTVFYCRDDAHAARLGAAHPGRTVSFGSDPAADYRFEHLSELDFRSRFTVVGSGGKVLGEAELNVPGRHNVSNALGVVALASELGVPFTDIAAALATFRGARRRFEFRHRGPLFQLVDDYGHHPSEIRATLATARAGHPPARGRVVVLFQPHRYTRTLALRESFGGAFGDADVVIVADVYPASEPPLPGVSGQTIVDELTRRGHPRAVFEPDFKRLRARVGALLRPGDLLVTLGAGNIHEVGAALVGDVRHVEAMRALADAGDTEVKLYEPMSRHTTLRVGGPAQFWAEPETETAFVALVGYAKANGLPVFVLGRGSNLLVRDGGIPGLVLHPVGGDFARLEVDAERSEITAGVGVGFKRLAGAAAKANLGGFEWMDGIPGAVGGSLRMNAGAMGVDTFSQVVRVRLLDGNTGAVREVPPEELEAGYRHVPRLRENYALAATLRGFPSTPEAIRAGLDASLAKRKTTQPIAASAGCIFKNPGRETLAGKLVDELGLKNRAVGAARVSEVHGNFIVNDDGAASAGDVLALIAQIQEIARRERGVALETEVQVVGVD